MMKIYNRVLLEFRHLTTKHHSLAQSDSRACSSPLYRNNC